MVDRVTARPDVPAVAVWVAIVVFLALFWAGVGYAVHRIIEPAPTCVESQPGPSTATSGIGTAIRCDQR